MKVSKHGGAATDSREEDDRMDNRKIYKITRDDVEIVVAVDDEEVTYQHPMTGAFHESPAQALAGFSDDDDEARDALAAELAANEWLAADLQAAVSPEWGGTLDLDGGAAAVEEVV